MNKFFLRSSHCFLVTGLLALCFINTVYGQSSPVFTAVRNNDFAALKVLLDKGVNPDAFDEDSDNVLINASMYASLECLQLLLEKKANPNLRNQLGQTPLMFCVQDTSRMQLLLHYGADINAKSNSSNTPLLIACMGSNQHHLVKFLLDHGAADTVKNAGKETAFFRACEFGDTMTLGLLYHPKTDLNESPWGFTALMAATRMANWPAVYFLLDHGADANIPDPINMTVLLWAAELNHTKLVKRLVTQTRNINTIDSLAGMTPLMWATYNEHDNPQIIQALIDNGAQVNIKAKDGSTALSWARKKGNTKTVAILEKAGAQ